MNIKTRILLAVFLLELLGYGALLAYTHNNNRETLSSIREHQIDTSISSTRHRINALTKLMEHQALKLAHAGEMLFQLSSSLPIDQLEPALKTLLIQSFTDFPESIGGGLWYEPNTIAKNQTLYGPYVFWSGDRKVEFTWDLNTEQYNYPAQDWYQVALPSNWPRNEERPQKSYWTQPYWDEAGSKELMMTVDALMFDEKKHIIGLSTVDWSLNKMTAFTDKINITPNSRTILIDNMSRLILSNGFDSESRMQDYRKYRWIKGLNIESLKNGETRQHQNIELNGEIYHVYATRSDIGLILIIAIPEHELVFEIDQATRKATLNGAIIIMFFIGGMLLLLEILFRPFQRVTQLINNSINISDDNKLSVEPIHYRKNNEFFALIKALNLIYTQINTHTKEIEEANKAKSIFLATMSHEIRTPMNAILGYAQLLNYDETLPKQHQRTLQAIESSGKHLLDLLSDILDITKIESGEMSLYQENHYIFGIFDALNKIFKIRCEQKGLEWRFKCNIDKNQVAYVDKAKLNQIVINLLGNSVKFTTSGYIAIQIIQVQNQLDIVIHDTGPGIEANKQANLFAPFSQGQEGIEHGGTGLGLSIVHKLCALMGGEINLERSDSKGTEFDLRIPIRAVNHNSAPARQDTIKNIADFSSSKLTALVIDDVEINRDILCKVLERIGIQSIQANNGREGLNVLSSHTPDLLFVDIQMPIMNGFEFLDEIKTNHPHLLDFCIAISANVITHNNDLVQKGFSYALSKPFQIHDACHIIELILQKLLSKDDNT
ncbi:MAG: signal transduction histidine kinase/ActR/RegA family two-component response regulator [Flavobacteriales bacterium]|jgi:signal transduction histidine kinase/ActR/RegA family two-component response regulator